MKCADIRKHSTHATLPCAISERPTTPKMATTSFRRLASAQSCSRRRNAWVLAGLAGWLTRMISSTVSIAITNVIAAVTLHAERGSRGHDDSEYKDNSVEAWPRCDADHEGNYTEPFTRALRTRLSSRRIPDPPSVAASGWCPAAARIQLMCLSAAPAS